MEPIESLTIGLDVFCSNHLGRFLVHDFSIGTLHKMYLRFVVVLWANPEVHKVIVTPRTGVKLMLLHA